jgi:hypothetical protein
MVKFDWPFRELETVLGARFAGFCHGPVTNLVILIVIESAG